MRDAWADGDERDAMIAEGDRLRHVLAAVERERDDARLREDSVHVFAKRLVGDGPNTMEIIRRAAVRHEELVRAARGLLLTYLRPADPMWCGCCAMYMDVPGHKSDCAAAALVRALNGEPQVSAPTAPLEPVPEIERLKAGNASLLESLRATKEFHQDHDDALARQLAAAEQRNTELEGALHPLREVVAAAEAGLPRIEAACARALAGDQKDWRTLRSTLTLVVERTQKLRASFDDALLVAGPSAARAALHDEERSAPQAPAKQTCVRCQGRGFRTAPPGGSMRCEDCEGFGWIRAGGAAQGEEK